MIGNTIGNTIVKGYAQALFEVANEKGVADEVEKDMESIKDLLKSNKKFRDVLNHPTITKAEKKNIIDKTIGLQCSKWVKHLLHVLIDKRRERILGPLADMFKATAVQIKGEESVNVQTAFPLSDSKLGKLKDNLEKLIKKKINLETEVKEDIIGGMVIKIGNRIIDGSVVNHLNNLKKSLLKATLI